MAVGSTELKVTLVGGHVFLTEVQEGSDPRARAKDILTYGAAEEHADGSYTIHPLSRISREGLNNPILGGTRSVAVRRSGYEGLSER